MCVCARVCVCVHKCVHSRVCVCLCVCIYVKQAQNNVSCLVCVCVWLRIAWASRPLSNRTDCPSPLPPQTSKTVVKILPSLLSKPISIWIWTTNLQMVLAETTFAQSTSTCHFWNYKKTADLQKTNFFNLKVVPSTFLIFHVHRTFSFHIPFLLHLLLLILLLLLLLLCRGGGRMERPLAGITKRCLASIESLLR